MKNVSEILDFFKANNCEVTIFDGKYTTFDIWSNVSNRYILQDANEMQLNDFYQSVSKLTNKK